MRLDKITDAYQKLKGSVYYDKSLSYIRTRIAEYESDDIDGKLSRLAKSLTATNWKETRDRITNSISVLTFPKQVDCAEDFSDESMVISNIQPNKTIVDGYNNFIDMDIEGFLVGILWVIHIGYKIDSDLNDNCYGNRLRDNLKVVSDQITASPNVFKPYFEQYESWRNKGLGVAQDYVNIHDTSVVIMLLDLTRYYYGVDFGRVKYESLIRQYCNTDEDQMLSDIVFSIISRYSEILGLGHNVLPIGFHPSNILANEYLKRFDSNMLSLKDVIYYGRYVDDIMLIKKIDDNSEYDRKIRSVGPNCIGELLVDEMCSSDIMIKEGEEYRLVEELYLSFQKRKFKFFYFDRNGSDELIAKIKLDIRKNSSEFKYVPDDYGTLDLDVQKIERDDTVNKLRGIRKTVVDKYVLSKVISRNIVVSPFLEENQIAGFANDIMNILDGKELLNNYLLWEKLLTYYVRNRQFDLIVSLSASIIAALDNLDEDIGKVDCYSYLSNGSIASVKESLVYHFNSCLARSLALVWGNQITQCMKDICRVFKQSMYSIYNYSYLKRLRKQYVFSRMIDKSVIPVCAELIIDSCVFSDSSKSFCLCNLEDIVENRRTIKRKQYKFAPYICSTFDIAFSKLMEDIMSGKGKLLSQKEYSHYVVAQYNSQFRGSGNLLSASITYRDGEISIGNEKCNSFKVAVSNVRMNPKDILDILDGKRADRSDRAKDVARLTNYAIENGSNVLVMPEAFVPYNCLSILAKKSAQHQMMIICGIEHIVVKGYVWNLTCTLIPFECNGVKYSIPYFCQKEYFSPREIKEIKKRSLVVSPTNNNSLFSWNNMKFVTYCCYELTNIIKRSEYLGRADVVFGIEWNQDVTYFGNIIESLSRDMYCYCVQSNMSEYGDSRIVQPAHSKLRDVLRVKGGENVSILVSRIDIAKLREMRNSREARKSGDYAELPAGVTWSESLRSKENLD